MRKQLAGWSTYGRSGLLKSIQGTLDQGLWYFSMVAVPAALAVLSGLAFFNWHNLYEATPDQQLAVRVIKDTATGLTPSQAAAQLYAAPSVAQYETHLSEEPLWFLIEPNVTELTAEEPIHIELPSRHVVALSCWDAASGLRLGSLQANRVEGPLTSTKAGYSVPMSHVHQTVMCRGQFQGPAKITAYQWKASSLDISASNFHRNSGLLDGGILMLACFVLLTALINRQALYLIFATWLFFTLRISSTAAGWDHQWLNHLLPTEWLPFMRSVSRGIWAILTVTLLKSLLRDELRSIKTAGLVTVSQGLCLLLFVFALVLDRDDFLRVMWGMGTITLVLLLISLGEIVMKTHSVVAIWYAAALTMTLVSGLSEIMSAALGVNQLSMVFNTMNSALVSSLLASLAIAEQMRQEHKRRLVIQSQLKNTYDTIPLGMFTLNLQGHFMQVNPAARRMLGFHGSRAVTRNWQHFFGAECWHQFLEQLQAHPDLEIEMQSLSEPDSIEPQRRYLVKAALSDERIEGSLQDVTEKSLALEELKFLAHNDALTKVLNRRGIEDAYAELLASADTEHPLAVAYLDLDRFKLINDLYGHNVGDEVLRQVCRRVQVLLAAHMRFGRMGGDEFVMLLPDTRMPLATLICRGIVENIDDKPFRVGEKAFYVRGSVGLIEVAPGMSFKEVLSTADRACREAKSSLQRGLVIYDQGSAAWQEHQAEMKLISEMTVVDTLEGLYVVMQPIMSLTRPSDTLNFEVLLRMNDSDGKPVPLNRLIAAAESCGRMSKIDHWVLSTTLDWLSSHRERLQRTQFVCVNLSGSSLNDEEFMQEVFDLLRRNAHVASYLSIEITESVALHDLKNTRRFIDRVRSLGARVALDDFGAGYTSFSYLKELPADLLKIDGSFVVNMNQHPANISIVEAIVNLARNLGMKTIAEWAEDAATVQTLAEVGVDYVQGYAVARPMKPEQLLLAESAASFASDPVLLQFIEQQDRQNHPLAQLDLLMDEDKSMPPKMH